MATNEILPFASTDTGTNLLTQAEYTADAQRTTGNQPGIARSKLVNKALRQSSLLSAGLAEFIADYQTYNVTDGLTAQNIADYLVAAIKNVEPKGTQYITTSSNFTVPAGVTEVVVEVWGGGGGGGGGDGSNSSGSGGGGGGYTTKRITGLTPGQTIACTIGSGGAGGATNVKGSAGSTTYFGAYCSATGGEGGTILADGVISQPVNGGSGIGGDLNLRGGCGMVQTTTVGGNGGDGARGSGGGRGAWQSAFNASAGAVPAGGGGGGDGPWSSAAGGSGAVLVRWGY